MTNSFFSSADWFCIDDALHGRETPEEIAESFGWGPEAVEAIYREWEIAR